MNKTLVILVSNPYTDREYETKDYNLKTWKNELSNIDLGNVQFLQFNDLLSGHYITISPKNFASVSVYEKEN